MLINILPGFLGFFLLSIDILHARSMYSGPIFWCYIRVC